jgi:aminoglycoside phosphotransferase (APT) family kinase protein
MKATEQLPGKEQERIVRPLLAHLSGRDRQRDGQWQDWQIIRIGGGLNNLLYRATCPTGDLAVKFTIRDGRHRASREHGALLALHQAGLPIAPIPILLDRTRYALPVVVQTWLQGEVSAAPPAADAEWISLLRFLGAVHSITPDQTDVRLRRAVLTANSAKAGRRLVQQQVARIPREARPASLQALLRRYEAAFFPGWCDGPVALCWGDPNTRNLIRRPGLWAAVDWENSGWGDPAFDVAELMTHPAYMHVPRARWEWVVDAYCDLVGDATTAVRIQAYQRIMLVWWVARVARYLYEVPRGLDERLVDRPADRQAEMSAKYEHYSGLAEGVL